MKHIKQVNEGERIYLFWDNGVKLGYCYQEVDGAYVFKFADPSTGSWPGYVLREIADVIEELNKKSPS